LDAVTGGAEVSEQPSKDQVTRENDPELFEALDRLVIEYGWYTVKKAIEVIPLEPVYD
jgi:hypothetical protein